MGHASVTLFYDFKVLDSSYGQSFDCRFCLIMGFKKGLKISMVDQ